MLKTLKQKYNWSTGAGLLIALLLATSMLITPASAANPPAPWETMWLYGTVTINGAPAPAGTAVSVYVGGTLNTSTTVDSSGQYGYTPQFYVTGSDGLEVTFKVGTTDAPPPITFAGGTTGRANLAIGTTSLNVSTASATVTSSSTATLNGSLTDKGGFSSVVVYFRYGTTTACLSRTDNQTRTLTGDFTANISALTPNTLYYYQAVAIGGGTVVYGSRLSLTTAPSVLAVTTSTATGVTTSAATLNGNLTDRGPNTSVNVYFEYGTNQGFGTSTTLQARTSTGAFTAGLSGLLSNTKYYFRSVAVGTTTAYGATLDFTTSVGSLSVSTGSATEVSATTATLNGTLTDLGANSSANVYFQWGLTTGYTGGTTAVQPLTYPRSFNASITGLSPGTTYNFRAVAVGATTVNGSNVTFTTSASGGGNTAPPAQFYGIVYIGAAKAGAGVNVAAYLNGSLAASTTTDSSGRYGYASLFYVPGNSGTVTFYVSGALVPQTATFTSGAVTKLNLYLSAPNCPGTKLIGADDASSGTNTGTTNAVWGKWSATYTGDVTRIGVKCNNSGNVKVAIYADAAGSPGARLNAVNTSTPVVAGWNCIPITATRVNSGTSYWLAYFEDTGCVAYQVSSSQPRRYLGGNTYSTFTWPATAPTLLDAWSYYDALAGWGN